MTGRPLALTLGDPAGIGPEIVQDAWRALRSSGPAFAVIGDAGLLTSVATRRITNLTEAVETFSTALPVLHDPVSAKVTPGRPDPTAAPAIIRWIETAAALALAGEVAGVVTAPISKAPLYAAGFKFPGHTEFLGELTAHAPVPGERGPAMMLAAGDLRTVLVTIHEPLAQVSALLTPGVIVRIGRIAAQALVRDFGIARPRLAVAGLNPHAGESGALGREEIEIVAPAISALEAEGIDARGPYPADTLFPAEMRATYDAAICLYHDQALIPVKMLDFWGGVNVTLGLPIIRTSPDHGTGFDIAGQGLARADSLVAAIRLAQEIAGRRG